MAGGGGSGCWRIYLEKVLSNFMEIFYFKQSLGYNYNCNYALIIKIKN